MKTTFIEFAAADGILLQGLLFEADQRSNASAAVAHLHGLAGSFYENAFIRVMAEQYTASGVAFLSFNNRGHDYIADLRVVGQKPGSRQGGGAHEVFSECTLDVVAAVGALEHAGYRHVYLQGHSTGANKAVYAVADRGARLNVSGIILMSPCDDIALMLKARGSEMDADQEEATLLKDAGNGDQLLRRSVFFSYPLSANAYLRDFRPGSAMDVFRYREPATSWGWSESIAVPMLATFGGEGDLLQQEPHDALRILRSQAKRCPDFTGVVVPGSGHSYSGKERAIAELVRDWVLGRCARA